MNRLPIVLAVVGLIVVVAFYQLPTTVVDDGDEILQQPMDSPTPTGTEAEAAEAGHTRPIPEGLQPILSDIRKKWQKSENPNDFRMFADSLAGLYFLATWYDSAAFFAEEVAKVDGNVQSWLKAGDFYYEAFTFATNEGNQQTLGEKARIYLQKVVEADPSSLDAKAKIGMTYVSGSNPMQGVLLLREVVEADPTNRLAIFNLGMLSRRSGQLDKAVERFESLLQIDPSDLQARFFLSLTFQELGEVEKAKSGYEDLLEMTNDPAIVETVNGLLDEFD